MKSTSIPAAAPRMGMGKRFPIPRRQAYIEMGKKTAHNIVPRLKAIPIGTKSASTHMRRKLKGK